MKSLPKILLALYLLTLTWLVLFKFSFDFSSVVLDHQTRSLNLIPFTGLLREMVDNFIIFIPFGLLLGVNFKKVYLLQKLAIIFVFSIAVEITQFVLAIGITDITDVIMNTLGGLSGLLLYTLGSKYINNKRLDQFIIILGLVLLVAFLCLRFFILRVKY